MERFIHPYFNFLGSESGSNNYYEIKSNEKISSDFYDIEIKIPETNIINISEEGNWGPARQNFSPSFENDLLNYMDFYTMTLDRNRYKVNQNHIIGCGDHHSLILTNIGKVLSFGRNNYGQLGNLTNSGTDNPNQNPLEIESANGYNKLNAISVACGEFHSTILLDTGKILSCGRNNYGQLGNPTNSGTDISNSTLLPVEAVNGYNGENGITVSCGGNHTVIIADEGTLLSCGRNNYGQLGHHANSGTDTPNEYVNQFTTTNFYNGINATAVSCGIEHTVVLLNTGKVLACGRNNYGQLGTSINVGTDISNATLLEVEHNADYDGENAIAIGCGDYHTAILLTTGKVITCGINQYGQL
jgi:alpha-tubulin suppressor-like RCC1 family protein